MADLIDIDLSPKSLEIASRRTKVSALVIEGFTSPSRIQQALQKKYKTTVSIDTVRTDLRSVKEDWKEARLRDYDAVLARELQKIDHLESVAWEEWKRSKRRVKKGSTKDVVGENPRVEELNQWENRLGDARYLDQIRWCIEKRCKLLGLEDKIAFTRRVEISSNDLNKATNEEIHLTLEKVFGSLTN